MKLKILKQGGLENIPESSRREVRRLVKQRGERKANYSETEPSLFFVEGCVSALFMHVLQIDITYFWHGNILHVINVETRFRNIGFINQMDVGGTWRKLLALWKNMLPRAPDFIYLDAGTNFHSSEFIDRAAEHGNIVRIAPIGAYDRICAI